MNIKDFGRISIILFTTIVFFLFPGVVKAGCDTATNHIYARDSATGDFGSGNCEKYFNDVMFGQYNMSRSGWSEVQCDNWQYDVHQMDRKSGYTLPADFLSTYYCFDNQKSVATSTPTAAPTGTVVPTATATAPTGTVVPMGSVNCWVCDACKWRGPYQRSGTSCPSGEFITGGPVGAACDTQNPQCQSGGGTSPTATGTLTPTISPTGTATPAIFTSEYRCSDYKFSKNDPDSTAYPWRLYQNSDSSGEPIRFNYVFSNNVTQGNNLTLFCQFKADTGETSRVYQQSIKYIGGDPKITSASCSYDPSGIGTQVVVKGLNFGTHSDQSEGNVKIADKESTISFWGENTESSSSASSSAGLKNKIVAKIRDKLDEGKYAVVVTTDEGRSAKGYCTIGTTTIDFTLKTTCRRNVSDLLSDDLSVEITEKADKAKPLVKNKIKTDKDGKPEDFNPKLEIGKTYILTIRGPKSIGKKVEFTAEEGTTALNDIILSVGDIYPVSSPDNVINAFDKSEMSREWSLINDVTRPADLNNDMRVNSVDYSCFLNNYNRSGD